MGVGDCSLRLLHVAILLEIRQDVKVYVKHIVLGPYDARTSIAIGVFSFWSDGEGNFVFVEIALVVRSQTDKDGEIAIRQTGLILDGSLRMGKELQPLVTTQVVGGRFIHRTGIGR